MILAITAADARGYFEKGGGKMKEITQVMTIEVTYIERIKDDQTLPNFKELVLGD